jgi:hypothetical protein
MILDLTNDQHQALRRYLRARLDSEFHWDYSALQPIREVLDMLAPPERKPNAFPPSRSYASPRATGKPRR